MNFLPEPHQHGSLRPSFPFAGGGAGSPFPLLVTDYSFDGSAAGELTPADVASCDRQTFDELLRPLFADDSAG